VNKVNIVAVIMIQLNKDMFSHIKLIVVEVLCS